MDQKLRRASPTPVYLQILKALQRQVAEGLLRPDTAIPSERVLCQRFGVSRATVRQAIAEGVRRGSLYRVNGRGAYVVGRAFRQEMGSVVRFPDLVRQLGATPHMRVLTRRVEVADVSVAKTLEVPPGSRVVRLTLLGLADSEPLATYEVFLPQPFGETVAEHATRLSTQGKAFSLYDLYERHGLPPDIVDQTFEATAAERSAAKLLKIVEGSPVFTLTSITYTAAQQPVEMRRAVYRGDRYKFTLRRRVSEGAAQPVVPAGRR